MIPLIKFSETISASSLVSLGSLIEVLFNSILFFLRCFPDNNAASIAIFISFDKSNSGI